MATISGLLVGSLFLTWLVATVICGVIVLIHAFRTSVLDGLLYLFLPFYSIYYLFAKFEHPKKTLIAVVLLGSPLIGVFAALSIYGVTRYMTNAKTQEARQLLPRVAEAAIAAVERGKLENPGNPSELPASTPPVPERLSQVAAAKYQSAPEDWSGNWTQLRFSIVGPQYFQYQWQRLTAESGVASGVADLNGDGVIDRRLELPVECGRGSNGALECKSGTVRESNR